MSKIIKSLNSINSFSKKIILFGCIPVLCFCLIGAGIITYNNFFVNEVALYDIGASMVQTSTVLFAQIVIGALVIDWFNAIIQNND